MYTVLNAAWLPPAKLRICTATSTCLESECFKPVIMKSIRTERRIFSLSNECKHDVKDVFTHGKQDHSLIPSWRARQPDK